MHPDCITCLLAVPGSESLVQITKYFDNVLVSIWANNNDDDNNNNKQFLFK